MKEYKDFLDLLKAEVEPVKLGNDNKTGQCGICFVDAAKLYPCKVGKLNLMVCDNCNSIMDTYKSINFKIRSILFRGKLDKQYMDKDEWVYGVPFIDFTGFCVIVTACYKLVVIPETICQYTGRTDKNGRKIFEGDIIEYSDHDDNFGHPTVTLFGAVVIWDEENFCYALKTEDCIKPFNDWKWDDSSVIGNVYDNPDFLSDLNLSNG